MRRFGGRGFTLLELLLSISLAAMMGAGISAALVHGQRAERAGEARAEALQNGRLALEWLVRDLQAASVVTGAFNPGLTGSDAELEGQPADSCAFTATSHLPPWREPAPDPMARLLNPLAMLPPGPVAQPPPESDVVQVEYAVGSDPTVEAPGLLRRVRTLPTIQTTAADGGYETQALAPDVVGLDLRWYDGSEWQTSWDSAVSGAFPVAAQVSVVVRTGPPDSAAEPRTFVRTVVLVQKPFKTTTTAAPVEGGVR